ncbi:hypothetical protein ASPZODRAFT_2052454 [Penicilliopsis zonata CBS 506.65]|uniref:Clr5 domain-containing protein n=1 Tax=Penicilliopsis zonata CBS 506.65 TaxID=1073090 RepID=A0A1L9SGC4_9EURO|nr:hypothetical protein ASPZODRAFT_2052454 [Penicilliopsis zonata CBS 506.65]OJJ46094.1 hypothetical protein ASPZODRAFT_2052454 [Penicilliopsis zonata CBS 506.65]
MDGLGRGHNNHASVPPSTRDLPRIPQRATSTPTAGTANVSMTSAGAAAAAAATAAGATTTPTTPLPARQHRSSSVFRPRRSDDWQDFRAIIEQLYRNDQLKLRDVKRIMERDYNFVASEKQYKDRLAAWHVRKNIKAKEVQLMIRKQQKRAARGKQTAFRVGGQEVDSKRIQRFMRRYGPSWEVERRDPPLMSPEPATPSDMSCYTPEPEDRYDPPEDTETASPDADQHTTEIDSSPVTEEPLPERALNTTTTTTATIITTSHHPQAAIQTQPQPHLQPQAQHRPQPPVQPSALTHSIVTSHPAQYMPKPIEEDYDMQNWENLATFQEKLLQLTRTMDQDLSEYQTPDEYE